MWSIESGEQTSTCGPLGLPVALSPVEITLAGAGGYRIHEKNIWGWPDVACGDGWDLDVEGGVAHPHFDTPREMTCTNYSGHQSRTTTYRIDSFALQLDDDALGLAIVGSEHTSTVTSSCDIQLDAHARRL